MIFISKKNCEICKVEYSNEEPYCPNCGSKNEDYIKSNDSLAKIQHTPHNFYESQIDNEIKKLNEVSVEERFNNTLGGIKDKFKKPKQTSIQNNSQSNKNNKIPNDKIKCPQCDTENDLYSRFCGICGFPLKNLKICPDCGKLYETYENNSFCEDCGTKIVDIKVCTECNNIMEFDAKFCGNCGHTF